MHGQHVTNDYLLRIVVLLNHHLVRVGGVMKSELWNKYWELWIIPVILMVVLIFIQTLHTYQHQQGNGDEQCGRLDK